LRDYSIKVGDLPSICLPNQNGVALGKTYPRPIVDHEWARKRALEAFAAKRGTPHAPRKQS